MTEQLLKVDVVNGVLNISIGVEALITSLESGSLDMKCAGTFFITNADTFIKEFSQELSLEDESGATPVHWMFDYVALQCLENGAVGCAVEGVC